MNYPVLLLFSIIFFVRVANANEYNCDDLSADKERIEHIEKYKLDNGLTVLIHPTSSHERVFCLLMVPVGSKHESTQEKGVAHLIEHMVFKGTQKTVNQNDTAFSKKDDELLQVCTDDDIVAQLQKAIEQAGGLAEPDYARFTENYGIKFNAFTSFDYTGYYMSVPETSWSVALPVMADCFQNCSFKQEYINSELKTVIQEMKMNNDDYTRAMFQAMLTQVFHDHPYHYPIIGYKSDLCHATTDNLKTFFKKNYIPANAVLAVVGNVSQEDVIRYSQKTFGNIPAKKEGANYSHKHDHNLKSYSTTLFQDVKQSHVLLSWEIPGTSEKLDDFDIETLSSALAHGANARLRKLLIDEKKMVAAVQADAIRLQDGGLYMVFFSPLDVQSIEPVTQLIVQVLDDIAKQGLTQEEIARARKEHQVHKANLMEDHRSYAIEMALSFLLTGDETSFLRHFPQDNTYVEQAVQTFVKTYLRPAVMHRVQLLPLPEQEMENWQKNQSESDMQDCQLLAQVSRQESIEEPRLPLEMPSVDLTKLVFNAPDECQLENGLTVLTFDRHESTQRISIFLKLQANYAYDSVDKPGLYRLMCRMIQNSGTAQYSKHEVAQKFEERGISFAVSLSGISMSMFKQDFSYGLSLLYDLVCHPKFDENELMMQKILALQELSYLQDRPGFVLQDLINHHIYGNHPKACHGYGTIQSINAIEWKDIVDFHAKYVSPDKAALVIVGNLADIDVELESKKVFEAWHAKPIAKCNTSIIEQPAVAQIDHFMNRDQVRLAFVQPSVDFLHPDYFKLRLFQYILGGGKNSRLYQLREQHGIFYTIYAGLVEQSDKEPGIISISTIVSTDRLQEAKDKILSCLMEAADSLTEDELQQAKNMYYFDLLDAFSNNLTIAQHIVSNWYYELPVGYYNSFVHVVDQMTVHEVRKAVKKHLKVSELSVFQVGRV